MRNKKSGLRAMVGEKEWEELKKIGHSIIPNDFMDFWSRFIPESCYFAYLEVCQGVVKELEEEELLKTMKKKKITKDDFVDPEVKELFQRNNLELPQNLQEILTTLESLQLIHKFITPSGSLAYDICVPVPTPDEILKWLPEDDRDFLEIMKRQDRTCHH